MFHTKKIVWFWIVVLIVAWLIGFVVFKTLGFLIHLLLLAAVGLAIYNFFRK